MKLSFMAFMCEMPLLLEGAWTEEKSAKIDDIFQYAAAAGYRGIDLTMATIENMSVERIRKNLEACRLSLASIVCFASLADPALTDEAAQAPYVKAMEAAEELGCSHVMLVPGFCVQSEDTEGMKQVLERRFRNLAEKAAEKNIICMIEDDPDLRLGMCRAADVEHFLKAAPGLKFVYDSANMIVAGEDPVEYYEKLKKDTVHMHIKDIAVCSDPNAYRDKGVDGTYFASAPHGTGMVDFHKLFHAICRSSYEGWLSLEFVPSGKEPLCEDMQRVYRFIAALASKCRVGVNEILLIPELVAGPYERVWKKLLEIGVDAVELDAIPDHSERIRRFTEEAAKRYPIGMPPCLSKGEDVFEMAENVFASGLKINSCHLLLCDAYPELIEECIPYMQKISDRTHIMQFVISCNFDSVEKVEAYLPHIQKAAAALAENGITLCYHNHQMDSSPLENGKTALAMVLEGCPDCMIQLDVGWAWHGGMDSIAFMKQHGDRIVSVHLKDLTADARERNGRDIFPAVGSGAVPIKEVLDHLSLCSIIPGRLIIDQDESTGDIFGDIAAGVQYIRENI